MHCFDANKVISVIELDNKNVLFNYNGYTQIGIVKFLCEFRTFHLTKNLEGSRDILPQRGVCI